MEAEQVKQTQKRKICDLEKIGELKKMEELKKIKELEDEVSELKEANKLCYTNERYLFGLYQTEKRKRKHLEKMITKFLEKENENETLKKKDEDSMMLSNEIL